MGHIHNFVRTPLKAEREKKSFGRLFWKISLLIWSLDKRLNRLKHFRENVPKSSGFVGPSFWIFYAKVSPPNEAIIALRRNFHELKLFWIWLWKFVDKFFIYRCKQIRNEPPPTPKPSFVSWHFSYFMATFYNGHGEQTFLEAPIQGWQFLYHCSV